MSQRALDLREKLMNAFEQWVDQRPQEMLSSSDLVIGLGNFVAFVIAVMETEHIPSTVSIENIIKMANTAIPEYSKRLKRPDLKN
jgi:hypothetical protein